MRGSIVPLLRSTTQSSGAQWRLIGDAGRHELLAYMPTLLVLLFQGMSDCDLREVVMPRSVETSGWKCKVPRV